MTLWLQISFERLKRHERIIKPRSVENKWEERLRNNEQIDWKLN